MISRKINDNDGDGDYDDIALVKMIMRKDTTRQNYNCSIYFWNQLSISVPIEYKGKKIYFFKERDIDRKWKKDPEAAFEKARKEGLLPQFD